MTAKKLLAVVFLLSLLSAAPLRGQDGSASKLQIRLYGGLTYLAGSDVNDGVSGLFQAYSDLAAAEGFPIGGGFKAAHLGLNFGGDIIFQITPYLGIGVGAGYLQASKESTMTVTHISTMTFTGKPSFNALPIKLGLFFTFPMSPGVHFNFNVGGGYYIAKMTSMIRLSQIMPYYQQLDNAATANGFGLQGGFGFDFRVGSNVFLFVEAQGQLANIGGFEGTSTDSDSGGYFQSEAGKLYYFEESFMSPKLYPMIKVGSTASGSWIYDSWVLNLREAKVNFSGGQFVAGILIRL